LYFYSIFLSGAKLAFAVEPLNIRDKA
jgi:hypothetical protein